MNVYKYSLPFTEDTLPWESVITLLDLPEGAQVLHVGEQGSRLYLWALVDSDPDLDTVTRRFHLVGTGWTVAPGLTYVGTIMVSNEHLVWHIFEEGGN